MPLFEFQCNSCSNIFEELVFSDKEPACPKCHSEKTEKILSRPCRNRSGMSGQDTAISGGSGSSGGCGGCSGGSCSTCGS